MTQGIRRERAAKLILFSPQGIIFTEGRSGRLNLPGGGIEPGESPVDALERELDEELGYLLADLGHFAWLGTHAFVTVNAHQPVQRDWDIFVGETDFLADELLPGCEVKELHSLRREQIPGHRDVTRSAKAAVAMAYSKANVLQRLPSTRRGRQTVMG